MKLKFCITYTLDERKRKSYGIQGKIHFPTDPKLVKEKKSFSVSQLDFLCSRNLICAVVCNI
jgi:hypothetical protein